MVRSVDLLPGLGHDSVRIPGIRRPKQPAARIVSREDVPLPAHLATPGRYPELGPQGGTDLPDYGIRPCPILRGRLACYEPHELQQPEHRSNQRQLREGNQPAWPEPCDSIHVAHGILNREARTESPPGSITVPAGFPLVVFSCR